MGTQKLFQCLFECEMFDCQAGLGYSDSHLIQVSYLATDAIFPEWNIWNQFLDESSEALRLDGLSESHPIEVLVIFNWIASVTLKYLSLGEVTIILLIF